MTTGIAFCGFVGSELRKEYTALGNVVNLSARLMMKADWNKILIEQNIAKNLSKQYQYESIGESQFKGFHKEIEAFTLTSKSWKKKQISYKGSFIGRKEETQKLDKLIAPIFDNKFGGIVYIHELPELENLVYK